jgi:hypothetical protein
LLKICGQLSLSETRNGRKSSIGAGSRPIVLATMDFQQAVAKRSVGRRVNHLDAPFFWFRHGALRAFTSLRDMSLHRSGIAALTWREAGPRIA